MMLTCCNVCALLTISVRPACTLGVLSTFERYHKCANKCRLAVVPNTPPARAAPIVFPSKERCSTIHNYNSSSTTKILAIGSRPTRKKLERLDPCHGHPAVSSGIHPWFINASIHIDEKRVSYATGMSAQSYLNYPL